MNIQLMSPAFAEGQPIPVKYTCEGSDVSPPLQWSQAPEGTNSLTLICDDPDAPVGTWVHWILFNLPPTTNQVPEKMPALEGFPDGSKHGMNDFRRLGYGGPCPPPGRPHRYFFRIYALKILLPLQTWATHKDVMRALGGNVLGEGQLMGTYQRK